MLTETKTSIIQRLEKTFQTETAYAQLGDADSKALELASTCLRTFNAITQNLPDCLELVVQPNTDTRKQGRTLRKEFDTTLKRQFVEHVLAEPANWERLALMGLGEDDISYMDHKLIFPKYRDRQKIYDITADHILPLSANGRNDFDNLCLIPTYLNLLRNRFHQMQLYAFPKASNYLSFVPKLVDGHVPAVPLIDRGFRAPAKGNAEIAARMNELFGAPIL